MDSEKIYNLIFTWKQGVLPYYKLGRKEYYEEHSFPKSFNYYESKVVNSKEKDFLVPENLVGIKLNMTIKEVYRKFKMPRYIAHNNFNLEEGLKHFTMFYKTIFLGQKVVLQLHFFNSKLFSYNVEFRRELKNNDRNSIINGLGLSNIVSTEILNSGASLKDKKGRFITISNNVVLNVTVSLSEFEMHEHHNLQYATSCRIIKVA